MELYVELVCTILYRIIFASPMGVTTSGSIMKSHVLPIEAPIELPGIMPWYLIEMPAFQRWNIRQGYINESLLDSVVLNLGSHTTAHIAVERLYNPVILEAKVELSDPHIDPKSDAILTSIWKITSVSPKA